MIKALYLGTSHNNFWRPVAQISWQEKMSKNWYQLHPLNKLNPELESKLRVINDERINQLINIKLPNGSTRKKEYQFVGLEPNASEIDYLARAGVSINGFDLFPKVLPNEVHFYHCFWLLEPNYKPHSQAAKLFPQIQVANQQVPENHLPLNFQLDYTGTSLDVLYIGEKIGEVPPYVKFFLDEMLYYLPEARPVQINQNVPDDKRVLVKFSIKLDRSYEHPYFQLKQEQV